MNLKKLFNTFKNNKNGDCSYMPFNNTTFNIYNNVDLNKLVKQFGSKFYLLSLTNNIYNKIAVRKARNLGVLMFGKWHNYIDVSVLINNKTRSDVIILAKKYKQKSIIEINNNIVSEINTI